ncbi:transketolase [Alteribacillus persepolensis]|uniref:Transketolase n=1 Tax=Alteribacillus persepolensis TaxID=568899 RepID=A0A1G8JUD5_9BACI|nr:thiamine pyrophosphate-dependent enzyme [Alteribacillus persepolensis]SDI34822.1 transketolase [Alteribacillus persepolensis]
MSTEKTSTTKNSLESVPLEDLVIALKKSVFEMGRAAGGGYIGQGLCSAEMIAALFFRKLRLDPENFNNPVRDRFLLSTGHYAISIYAAMAQLGMIDKQLLDYYSADGSPLEMIGSETTPGLEIGGGSLGQGLSRGIGHALSAKLRNHSWKTYVYMSDGEMQEGQVWEAAMVASHHGLDNLILIIDNNGMQVEGKINQITSIDPIVDKWKIFGWNVKEINGNNLSEVMNALETIPENNKPTVIISNTIMGNGISFLHDREDAHYVKWSEENHVKAISELGGR